MATKLLKAKPKTTASHNQDLQNLVDKVQKENDVPFQVRLGEDLATRVKVFSAQKKLTHKEIVTQALELFLKDKEDIR
jgi:hypothetical protein